MHSPDDATMNTMDSSITSERVPSPQVGFTTKNALITFLANKITKYIQKLTCKLLVAKEICLVLVTWSPSHQRIQGLHFSSVDKRKPAPKILFSTFQEQFYVVLILFYPIKRHYIRKTNSLAAIAICNKYVREVLKVCSLPFTIVCQCSDVFLHLRCGDFCSTYKRSVHAGSWL
jgi:hypothetical protein